MIKSAGFTEKKGGRHKDPSFPVLIQTGVK